MELFEAEIIKENHINDGIKIELIDPTEDHRYYDYVMNHPASTIYHHPLWKVIIEKAFKHLKPYYRALFDEQNVMIGVMPGFISGTILSRHAYISLPMLTHCGPLFNDDETMHLGLKALIRERQKNHYKSVELRFLGGYPIIAGLKFQPLMQYVTHILKIDKDINELRKSFHKTSTQQRIRQAEKSGLTLQLGTSKHDIKIFNHLLSLTRRKLGLLPLPSTFFDYMWELFLPEGLVSLLMVYYKEQCISAMIVLKFKNRFYSEYTGTDPRFLKFHPNHFIFWKAIEMAHQEGYSEFDFGRSSVDNLGLISFKDKWRGEKRNLYYCYFPKPTSISAKSRDSLKFRMLKSIFSKMPLRLLQFGGRIFYNYIN